MNIDKSRNNVVQLCSSLGEACGIASYTEMLCEAHKFPKVKNLREIGQNIPRFIHLQHEYGIYSAGELKKIIKFCKKHQIKLYTTMHNIPGAIFDLNSFKLKFKSKLVKLDNFVWDYLMRYKSVRTFKKIKRSLINGSSGINLKKKIPPDPNIIGSTALIIKNSNKIIVHSKEAKDKLLQFGSRNVDVIFHPTKTFSTSKRLFSETDGKFHIGFFGFLHPAKSLLKVIDACKRINNVILHIYSSAANKNIDLNYKKKILNYVSDKKWIKLDMTHHKLTDVVSKLSRCDVNVWYSGNLTHISTSGSIRQYLAAKRPIIASDNLLISDLKEIIPIIPFNNMEALTNAICNFSKDTKKIEEYILDYEWEKLKIAYV